MCNSKIVVIKTDDLSKSLYYYDYFVLNDHRISLRVHGCDGRFVSDVILRSTQRWT